MKQIISEGKSYLCFPDNPVIIQRYETVGLIIAPEEGNTDVLNYFQIFISADTRKKIKDFIAYQENQGQLGFKSIQVHVRPLEIPVDYGIEPTIEKVLPSFEEVTNAFDHTGSFLTQIGGLNISIEQVFIATKPPYEIMYTIDPSADSIIETGKANRVSPYTFQFEAHQSLISCQVDQGEVEMNLHELDFSHNLTPRLSKKFSRSISPAEEIPISQEYTGHWQAELKGVSIETSIFTLKYGKRVL